MAIQIGYCPVCLRKLQLSESGHLPPHEPSDRKRSNIRCPGSGAVAVAKPTSSKEDRSNPPIADEQPEEETTQ